MKKKLHKKKSFLNLSRGISEIPILLVILLLGVFLVGGLLSSYNPGPYQLTTTTTTEQCCDSGNGSNCHTLQPTLTYNGTQYGLLKSNVSLKEGGNHLKYSGQTFENKPIVINTTMGFTLNNGQHECGQGKNDQIWNPTGNQPECIPIPHGEIVYLCDSNCFTDVPSKQTCDGNIAINNTTYCYGNTQSRYDVYFRLADENNPGIPDVIKNCLAATTPSSASIPSYPKQTVIPDSPYPSHASLQLHTFTFATSSTSSSLTTFVSPYCKPAIYLYPKKTEQVHVAIAPKGILKLTIPAYPSAGWSVTANPGGTIEYENKSYPYLFYEAGISDAIIPRQNTGYVVAYSKLANMFNILLPQLGLNTTEQKAFSTYWLRALPKNPYYQISIVPETVLDQISPLTISPKPDSVVRVTLSFKPLDTSISITPPVLPKVARTGFTVVEWGGLFKRDASHPFTCFM